MSTFYFRSYNRTVGRADTLEQLQKEMDRLIKEDVGCVEYHVKEGHIAFWVRSSGYPELANSLARAHNSVEASAMIKDYLNRRTTGALGGLSQGGTRGTATGVSPKKPRQR